MVARLLCLEFAALALFPAAGLAADMPANPDLTLRARAILHRYCGDCHKPDAPGQGEISVLDRTGLNRTDRPFLLPGSADASQLLQLMEDGSMPPGTHPRPSADERQAIRDWINAGAADYPRQFGESYALSSILADVRRVPPADQTKVRYFSLHHLVPDSDAAVTLEPQRLALRKAVVGLAKQAQLEGVDPAQLVFRINLKTAGWDLEPFQRRQLVDGKATLEPSHVNLFDLILIEYPLARLDASTAEFKQLAQLFLKPSGQAVPITYLRGDWFAAEFSRSSVASEIRDTLELPEPARESVPSAKPPQPPANPAGVPILPLDSVLQRNMAPDPPPFHVLFEAQDPKDRVPKTRFKVGERLGFYVRPSKQVWVEILWTDAAGKCQVPNLGSNNLIDGNQDKFMAGRDGQGYRIAEGSSGKELITIFASEAEFPPGTLLKTKRPNERVIHPFYSLPGTETRYDFDPGKIVKKTIEIEIIPR
jgi:mono/diheme cytochrome c family protein